MISRRATLLALPFLILAVGCAKKATVVGKWKVDPQLVSSPPAGVKPDFMTGFASTFTYEFKDDKTFKGSMSEGTYTVDGTNVAITTTKLAGQDLPAQARAKPQMTGQLSEDGNTLTLNLPKSGILPASLSSVKMVRDKS
ncbi:hypothetical protein [Fimbriimonas ginsengisoli]|uniref:Lipocalin-like domain-containing protein n=1 Tax=Fimbriimonas ginsengisoli Gsoil 348 TaxID=661478 RepID=A0A068NQT2_FIMGI|nr:hypothetical protein [Fimbriimonas ginsengisoli]AIE85075.1 hypothetical protein OP10G_1707 [Fimbriimonas ginsengisoli Gsoil 348]